MCGKKQPALIIYWTCIIIFHSYSKGMIFSNETNLCPLFLAFFTFTMNSTTLQQLLVAL